MTKIKQTVEDTLRQQVDNEIFRYQSESTFLSRHRREKFVSAKARFAIGMTVLLIGIAAVCYTCMKIKSKIPVAQTIEYQQHIKNFKR